MSTIAHNQKEENKKKKKKKKKKRKRRKNKKEKTYIPCEIIETKELKQEPCETLVDTWAYIQSLIHFYWSLISNLQIN